MKRRARVLAIVAGVVVLAAVVAALGYAFTRGDGPDKPRYPGRIAVRDGCGLRHMFFDATDQRTMCLPNVFDTVSVSRNGDKLAWDTTGGTSITVSEADGSNPLSTPVPLGSNVRLAYVQNWSEDTLEGQISLVRPNGDDPHTVIQGDSPDWSPDGKTLVYVRNGAIWTVNADGSDAQRLIPNGHSPAWSRDGEMIAFMRTDKCGRNICPEHAYFAFANGTDPRRVGPMYASERQIVWLPDPFE